MTENCVFNEKVHAFLIGLFYQELKAAEGPAGEECFIKAVQRTAEQRGHRMALRAMIVWTPCTDIWKQILTLSRRLAAASPQRMKR